MIPTRMLATILVVFFLSACGNEESTENFVGRWTFSNGHVILQIDEIKNNRLGVEFITFDTMRGHQTSYQTAKVEDGILTIGEAPFGESYRYEVATGHILAPDGGSYSQVPAGWTWGDGYDEVE